MRASRFKNLLDRFAWLATGGVSLGEITDDLQKGRAEDTGTHETREFSYGDLVLVDRWSMVFVAVSVS